MPLCFPSKNTTTDPQVRQFEKRIAEDARVDQKNLDHAIRDLKNAEKTHMKAIKVSRRLRREGDRRADEKDVS